MLIDSRSAQQINHSMSIPGKVHSVAFSPDGAFVTAAGSTGVVQEWSTVDGSAQGPPMTGHTGSVRAVAYSPDGQWIVTGGIDNRVILRPRGPGSVRILTGHRDWVNAFAFTDRLALSHIGRRPDRARVNRWADSDLGHSRQGIRFEPCPIKEMPFAVLRLSMIRLWLPPEPTAGCASGISRAGLANVS